MLEKPICSTGKNSVKQTSKLSLAKMPLDAKTRISRLVNWTPASAQKMTESVVSLTEDNEQSQHKFAELLSL